MNAFFSPYIVLASLFLLNSSTFSTPILPNQDSPPPIVPTKEMRDSVGLRYIIKLKKDKSQNPISSFISDRTAKASTASLASVAEVQKTSPNGVRYGVRYKYNSTLFNGLSAVLTDEDLKALKDKHEDDIEYIEEDKMAFATDVGSTSPLSWGQTRVASWNLNLNLNQIHFPAAGGQGVDVYVMDTGLNYQHPSFEGRANLFQNYVREEGPEDLHGHGTHVAGTIASVKFGIARKARVHGVKVLNSKGTGLYSRIMSAVEAIAAVARPCKTVINLSLAGEFSQALNDVMAAARKKGIVVVVAAGNDHIDACGRSPASSVHALTVGATDQQDAQASFSNYGRCVDVFAPGVNIISLSHRGRNDESCSMSGTSMASPHVAAVAALFMSMKSYTSADAVVKDILGWSHSIVKGAAQGSGTGLVFANPPNLK